MPQVFNRGGLIAASSGLLGAGAAIVGPIARSRQSRLAKAYGSARWAKPSEIHAAGLRRPSGVFLGRFGGGAYTARWTGTRHGICADALGQGSGACGSDASHLAELGGDPRHQGRELAIEHPPLGGSPACSSTNCLHPGVVVTIFFPRSLRQISSKAVERLEVLHRNRNAPNEFECDVPRLHVGQSRRRC